MKILWIQYQDNKLSLGFASLEDAHCFLRKQSSNLQWLAQWTLRMHPQNGQAIAETHSRVVLHFQ